MKKLLLGMVGGLGLMEYLPDVEICGTEKTPTCKELLVNPNCGCILYRMGKSKDLLEHIEDIRQVAAAMWRLTKSGGVGIHLFPGSKNILE